MHDFSSLFPNAYHTPQAGPEEKSVLRQGMVELAKPEFTSELEFRDPEFEKSSNKVRSI